MGNQKLKWTAEEEEALLAGIAKHGPGKWKNILTDPEFAPSLTHRSNIDLKDKWRNLCVNNGGPGSKDKSRTSRGKLKALPPPDNAQNSDTADGSGNAVMADPSTNEVKAKNAPRYNAMIFDALSTIKDANGCDTSAIVHFVERNYLVPPNVRRVLGTRLRKLVSQGKLEKVQSRYRIRKDTLLGTRLPIPKQKDIRPQKLRNPRLTSGETVVGAATSAASKIVEARKEIILGSRTPIPKQKHIRLQQLQNPRLTSGETLERAATSAASKIAEAENKSYLAADKVKEAERLSKMAEENDAMLQLVKEIYEQCLRGEILLSA